MQIALRNLLHTFGGERVFPRKIMDLNDLLEQIRQGLPPQAMDALMDTYSLTAEDLAKPLGVSLSTLKRRHRSQHLNPSVSDRLYRIANILTLATETLGNQDKAVRWLHKPNRALSGDTPLSRLDTQIGYEQVEDILFRIEHGIAA